MQDPISDPLTQRFRRGEVALVIIVLLAIASVRLVGLAASETPSPTLRPGPISVNPRLTPQHPTAPIVTSDTEMFAPLSDIDLRERPALEGLDILGLLPDACVNAHARGDNPVLVRFCIERGVLTP